jgi:ribosomal protein S18 acetylase RimI-like enzyme
MSLIQLTEDNLSKYSEQFVELSGYNNDQIDLEKVYPANKDKLKSFLGAIDWNIESFWVFVEDDQVVGRIGAYIPTRDDEAVHIGFFEVKLDHPQYKEISIELYKKAMSWGKSLGRSKSWAPLNRTTFHDYRYRVDEYKDNHFWEPQNPSEYVTILNDLGYETGENYTTFFWDDNIGTYQAATMAVEYLKKENFEYNFREIDLKGKFEVEAKLMYDLNTKIYAESFKIDDISFENFKNLMMRPLSHIDLKYSMYILNEAGAEIGFMFSFQDDDRLILKSFSVLPEYQGLHLGSALMHETISRANNDNVPKLCGALMQTKTKSHHFAKKNGVPTHEHKYKLFYKDL